MVEGIHLASFDRVVEEALEARRKRGEGKEREKRGERRAKGRGKGERGERGGREGGEKERDQEE